MRLADVPRKLNRRRLLAGAAAAGATATASAAGLSTAAPALAAPASTASFVSADPVLHLLRRATYGPHPGRPRPSSASSASPAGWTGSSTRRRSTTAPATRCSRGSRSLALDIAGVRGPSLPARLKKGGWDVMQQLGTAAVARAAWSSRQLFEVMVDFWSNHLNVTCPSGGVWDSRHGLRPHGHPQARPRQVRRHAQGRAAAPGDADLPGQPVVHQGASRTRTTAAS